MDIIATLICSAIEGEQTWKRERIANYRSQTETNLFFSNENKKGDKMLS